MTLLNWFFWWLKQDESLLHDSTPHGWLHDMCIGPFGWHGHILLAQLDLAHLHVTQLGHHFLVQFLSRCHDIVHLDAKKKQVFIEFCKRWNIKFLDEQSFTCAGPLFGPIDFSLSIIFCNETVSQMHTLMQDEKEVWQKYENITKSLPQFFKLWAT